LIGLFEPLTDEPLAWAVRKDNPALLAQLNQELALIRREGRLQEILNKWLKEQVLVGGM
jgi:ABC-type amino acid transport substrate-binding protein